MLRAYKRIGSTTTFGVSFIDNYDYKLRASKYTIPSPSQLYEGEGSRIFIFVTFIYQFITINAKEGA